jgi:hypothetical protein
VLNVECGCSGVVGGRRRQLVCSHMEGWGEADEAGAGRVRHAVVGLRGRAVPGPAYTAVAVAWSWAVRALSRARVSRCAALWPAAVWQGELVAVKFFRADVSPDGRTEDEVGPRTRGERVLLRGRRARCWTAGDMRCTPARPAGPLVPL